MEFLLDALASVIEKDPLGDPFLPEWITIQSRGMRQWISLKLAEKFKICANFHYFFPRDIVEKFAVEQNFSVNNLFWKIMDMLPQLLHDDRFATIKNYLIDDKDGVYLYQLTRNITSLFDDYRIYRPDLLMQWENSGEIIQKKDRSWAWQPVLLRRLIKEGFDFSLISLDSRLDTKSLPRRISVFGISSYPPSFLNFFNQLNSLVELNMFLLMPSREFFAYAGNSAEQQIDVGNPILASLGKSGRDLQLLLEEFDYHEPEPEMWHDPLLEKKTMLSHIQSDILNLFERGDAKEKKPVNISILDDKSISIHSCHTPLREVQVLKDQLLDLFETNHALNPDDVIVMMPDIESYAPLIKSVFSVEHKLPFAISDKKLGSESKTIKAYLKILNIISSKFELHQVLDLLTYTPIAEKFSIDIETDEIKTVEEYAVNAGIRWGIDANHKSKAGFPEFYENTFKFGIKRIMLGYAMPDQQKELFLDVLPADCPGGSQAEIIGKFTLFLDTLFKGVKLFLKNKSSIPEACKALKFLLNTMINKVGDNESDFLFILDNINEMEKETLQAGFEKEISLDVIVKVVEEKLSQSVLTGSFMTGGITFCNLTPMRSIPFKIVALLGMGEHDFPRKAGKKNFDLIAKFPRVGDKNIRDEDRYLFLEALISARENLIITYTGRSVKDNSLIPCSSIVNELQDVLKQSFNTDFDHDFICYHPLHPFDTQYFQKDSRSNYFSFSPYSFKIAKTLLKRSGAKEAFFTNNLVKDDLSNDLPIDNITLDDLCYFLKQPIEYMIKNTLGITFNKSKEETDDREPLVLNSLENFQIGSEILEKGFNYEKIRAAGKLPFGTKGRVDLDNIHSEVSPIIGEVKTIIKSKILPSRDLSMDIGGVTVSGSIDQIRENHGRFVLTFGQLNGQRLLNAWIYHLALNAVFKHDHAQETVLVGKCPARSKDRVQKRIFHEIEAAKAGELLSNIVKRYITGQTTPFVFFPETSFEFVKNFYKIDQDRSEKNLKALFNKCRSKWFNSHSKTGEKINRYNDLYFGEHDFFKTYENFSSSGFIENSIEVFGPLMENME